MPTRLDELYYELTLRADQLTQESAAVEQAGQRIAAAMNAADVATQQVQQQTAATATAQKRSTEATTANSRAWDNSAASIRQSNIELAKAAAAFDAQFGSAHNATQTLAELSGVIARNRADLAAGAITSKEYAAALASVRGEALALQAQAAQLSDVELKKLNTILSQTAPSATTSVRGLKSLTRGLVTVGASAAGAATGGFSTLISALTVFAPGGAVVLGVLGTLAAFALATKGYRERTKEAKDELEKLIESLEKAARLRANPAAELEDASLKATNEVVRLRKEVDKLARRVEGPLRFAKFLDLGGFTAAQQRLEDLRKELARIETAAKEAGLQLGEGLPGTAERDKVKDFVVALEQEAEALGKTRVQLAALAVERLRREGNLTPQDVDELLARAKAAAAILDKADADKKAEALAKKIAQQQKQLAEEQAQLLTEFRGLLAAQTTTLVDDMETALAALEERFRKTFGETLPAGVQAFFDATRAAIGRQAIFEELEGQLDRITTDVQNAVANLAAGIDTQVSFDVLAALDGQVDAATQLLAQTTKGTEEYQQQKKLLEELLALRAKILKAVADAGKAEETATKRQEDQLRRANEQAHQIESAARGALQLAEAFGVADEKLSSILQNLIQVGANIGPLIAALKAGGAGAIVGAALPVIGGIAGLAGELLGGENPEAKAHRQLLERNNDRLEDLTQKIGQLDLLRNTPASTVGGLREALGDLLGRGSVANRSRAIVGKFGDDLREALAAVGLSMADLDAVAQRLGIQLDGSVASVQQLLDALNTQALAAFADSLDGILEGLDLRFATFDIDDPLDQLEELQRAIGRSSRNFGELGDALANLDLSTAEGREAARRAIQDIVERIRAGTLDPSALGDLSLDELLRLLRRLDGTLDDVGDALGDQTTQGLAKQTTISEATGQRLGDLLATGNAIGRQQLTALFQITDSAQAIERLIASAVQPIPTGPPTLPRPGGGTTEAITVAAGAIVITVEAAKDPEAVADTVRVATAEALDAALGRQFARARAANGLVIRRRR